MLVLSGWKSFGVRKNERGISLGMDRYLTFQASSNIDRFVKTLNNMSFRPARRTAGGAKGEIRC